MSESSRGRLAPESGSLIGLPTVHRDGLIGVTVVAGLSFFVTTALFIHLTIKLVQWHVRRRRRRTDPHDADGTTGVDLTLGLAPKHFQRRADGRLGVPKTGDSRSENGAGLASFFQDRSHHNAQRPVPDERPPPPPPPADEPNQFVVLLYNLLLADMHQSMAFLLNGAWLVQDSIDVGTSTCWAQGWFVSTGDLAASLFITAIAVHTYVVAIQGWKPSQRAVILTCTAIWAFNYLMVLIGILATKNGASGGGFYVRAAAWCWINKEYDDVRLLTHYLFIFMSLASTTFIYSIIFLRLTKRSLEIDPSLSTAEDATASDVLSKNTSRALRGGYSWGFLSYPVIYLILTSPLAIGRILTMTNIDVSIVYFCTSGALIAANGLLDVLMWGFTRRDVVFGDGIEAANALGLETFSFMRTPQDRKYGNMIWVQGAGAANRSSKVDKLQSADGTYGLRRWSWWSGLGGSGWVPQWGRAAGGGVDSSDGRTRRGGIRPHRAQRSISQESLRGAAGRASNGERSLGVIQMDLVTTVVIETDPESSGQGLVVRPADYIATMGPLMDDGHRGAGVSAAASSSHDSTKGMAINMDILNRP
ncbi:hypothetical protein MAPG_04445 [Magnaporthiopsis poae ATCC 64411]|uniref:Uncharacterized protein n=1 Tax=Magnaporthiopsis poae (strain ATCC 64411 / 73-15) TaxID=644358 RepID=A0A0C4DWR5_MAGP6|nr:hypothetical protein MAPG_04445 [Magnaporthiopsis poae ATCC 64411]